jgi:heme/copper-type cytochrome/quinol oxidase subunit 1
MTAIPHPLAAAHHDDAHAHGHPELGFLKKYVFSADHKTIGIQFLFMGLFFFVIGGLLAMLIRWQLAWPSDPAHPVPILGKWMGWAGGVMPADFYTMVFSMHATVMIFFVIIPLLVGTFGNYLIPLKIGAGDMAFPFLNGLAFWSALPAGTIMMAGFGLAGGAAAAGWTSYPPLSALSLNSGVGTFTANWARIPGSTWTNLALTFNLISFFLFYAYICAYYVKLGSAVANFAVSVVLCAITAVLSVRGVQVICWDGQSCWFFSLFWLGFSSLMGAVNYLTTIIKLRCPGMTMFRMPLSVWSLFITSILVLLATPVLAGTLLMNLLEHQHISAAIAGSSVRLASFFTPYNWIDQGVGYTGLGQNSGGGYVILHQHLFWFCDGGVCAQADLRVSADGLRDGGYRVSGLHRLGAPHVPERHESDARNHFRREHDLHCRSERDQDVQLVRHAVAREHSLHDGDVERTGVRGDVRHRRVVRHLHGVNRHRRAHPRHLLHRRPHPLRAVRRKHLRHLRGDLLLVPEDVRAHDERDARQDSLLAQLHLLQRDVLRDAHPGHHGHAPPHRGLHTVHHVSAPSADEPVHQLLRLRAGAEPDSVRDQLHR